MYSNKIIFVCIFWAFSFSCLLTAQNPPKNYVIAGVTVEGNTFADTETIINLSGLQVGQQITIPGLTKMQLALKNLWERKQFSDIEILIDRFTPVGIFLIIRVKEFPRLSQIEIIGSDKVRKDDINKAIAKNRGDVLTPYDEYLAKQNIKKLYKEEDLFFAKIETQLIPTDTAHYFKLIVKIEEGVEFTVYSIDFNGNKYFDDGDLRSEFEETHEKVWWKIWRSSKFNSTEYETDKKLLVDFYKKNGYIDAEIIKDTIIYDVEKERVYINIDLNEGSKFFIRNISFTGNTVYPESKLLSNLDFKKGDVYDIERFTKNLNGNEEQSDVSSLYMDNGFLKASIQKEENRVSKDSIDLVIRVFENDRVSIRKIEIVGNTKTMDKVIRRELYTRPGDYFDRSAVIRSIRALGALNYFNPEAMQQPDIKPVGDQRDFSAVDITYKVEERSTDMFNASIGFAGSYGLTGSVGFTMNNFSIKEPLYGGAGQILNFNAEFGQSNRYQSFSLGFTEPWLFNKPTTVGFNLFYSWINYYYNLRRAGGTINFGRRFRWPDDYFRGDWSIRLQENLVEGDAGYYYRTGLNTEITVSQAFSRISYDSPFFPTSGSKFSLTTSFAMGALGLGSTDYFKNQLIYEIATPLYQVDNINRVVFFLSTNIGYITGFESDTALSPVELYYMGGNGLSGLGVTPLRGYTDRAIGPTYGGRVLSKYTAELRFAVSLNPMPIYIYGFAEAGNVWSAIKNVDPFNLKRSAGVGVQLLLNPIGIIGFSYGYGFDKDDENGEIPGWQFLFHLGQ